MLQTLKGLYPTATPEQIERNQKALIKNAIENGHIDEDTPDSEGMEDRYQEEVDQEQHEYDLDVAKTDASYRYN